jgi:hypothetical protein
MMSRIDDWLIDHIEACSQWVQEQTGWNCFTLSRAALVVYCVAVALELIWRAHVTFRFTALDGFSFIGLASMGQAAIRPDEFESLSESYSERVANPRRYSPAEFLLRMVGLALVLAIFLVGFFLQGSGNCKQLIVFMTSK